MENLGFGIDTLMSFFLFTCMFLLAVFLPGIETLPAGFLIFTVLVCNLVWIWYFLYVCYVTFDISLSRGLLFVAFAVGTRKPISTFRNLSFEIDHLGKQSEA